MSVRLQYDIDFMAGIYYGDTLQLNQYSVALNLLTMTTDTEEINIAMNRVKCFIWSELENTVFINQAHAEKAEMMSLLGINVTTLPEEPVDQIIGMMLYYKLNAIMEGNMIITALDVSSELGDSVWYQHDEDDAVGPFARDGWWHRPTCQHSDVDIESTEENVVKVSTAGWHEYGLEWPGEHSEENGNTVVFANFQRNEKEPTR